MESLPTSPGFVLTLGSLARLGRSSRLCSLVCSDRSSELSPRAKEHASVSSQIPNHPVFHSSPTEVHRNPCPSVLCDPSYASSTRNRAPPPFYSVEIEWIKRTDKSQFPNLPHSSFLVF